MENRDQLIFDPPDIDCCFYLPGLPNDGGYIKDRSPYGHTGTISGALWKILPTGLWYLHFDGTDDNADFGINVQQPLDVFSRELWIYPTIVDASVRTILGGMNGEGTDITITGANKIAARIRATANQNRGNTTAVVNTWYHVISAYDKNAGANNQNLYINGALDNDDTNTGDLSVGPLALTMGTYSGKDSQWYGGGIALVRLWTRALNPFEVLNNYNRDKHWFGRA